MSADRSPRLELPTVSIVLPTFDRLPLLKDAIASVLAQSRPDWELIVVDDGSRDGTTDYIRALADPRIHALPVARCGSPAKLRNLAISLARGVWVAFIDSDDLWMPNKLERQLRAVADHPECRWSYTRVLLIDEGGAALPPENYKPWTAHSGNIVRELLAQDALVACPSVLARRDFIEAAGGFDESLPFSEDYDLWLRLALRSPVCAVAEALGKVRLHPGNSTRDRPEVNRAFIRVYTKFLRYAGADPTLRRLCNRQRAFYWLDYGRQMWRAGERLRGAAAMARALSHQPDHPELWTTVLKKLLRAGARR